jgi:hypothetical protein
MADEQADVGADEGGRRPSAKRKRAILPDSSTQEFQEQQFHFPDDNIDTSSIPAEYREGKAGDSDPPGPRRRHLLLAIPVVAFAHTATTFSDFRDDHVYQQYKRALALFVRLYIALSEERRDDPSHGSACTDAPLFYVELVAGVESTAQSNLSSELKTMMEEKDASARGVYQNISKTLEQQTLRNLDASAWRFHIVYLETHPLNLYMAKHNQRIFAARASADDDDDEKAKALLQDIIEREGEQNQSIKGSRLAKAFCVIRVEMYDRIAAEQERGAAAAVSSDRKGSSGRVLRAPVRPAARKDPFEYFRSVADIFNVLKDATHVFNAIPSENPMPLETDMPDMEDMDNPWSFAQIFSVERVIGLFAAKAAFPQKRAITYLKGEFPISTRVWYLTGNSVKRLWQGRMFNVEDPEHYGLRHTHLEEVMRSSDLSEQVHFLKYRRYMNYRRGIVTSVSELVEPLLRKAHGFEFTGKNPELDAANVKKKFLIDVSQADLANDTLAAKRRRQLDDAVQAAVRDHVRCTSYFRPELVAGVTWATLSDDHAHQLRDLEDMCVRLIACGVSNVEVQAMRVRIQLQKKIDMIHKVDKLIADATSNEKLSDVDKKIAEFGTAFLRKHESFYHFLGDNKSYSDLSPFGEYLNWISLLWRHVFQCNRNIPVCMLIFVSLFHQYRPCKMNPHVLLIGDQSAGKSFLLDIAQSMFIKHTLFDFTSMSDRAQHVAGDISGKGYLCQELDPEIFGGVQSNPKGKKEAQSTTTTEALWKNKLTSNVIYVEVFDRDKDGKRVTLKIEVLANCTYVFCTNYEGTQSHKSAMKSRFTCIELPPNSEHNKAKVSNLARESVAYSTHKESQFEKFQMIQHLVWRVSHLIGIKAMQEPDLRAAENFARQILERAAALGAIDTGEIRKVDRLLMNLETFVIITAVWQEFVMNGSRSKGGMYEPEDILNCEPRMVATMEQLRFVLDLHAAQFEDRVQLRIAQAVQRQFMPTPAACLIHHRFSEQAIDPTKPYWQMYVQEQTRIGAGLPEVARLEGKSEIHRSLGITVDVSEEEKRFMKTIQSIQRAGNIVRVKNASPDAKELKDAKDASDVKADGKQDEAYTYYIVDTERIATPKNSISKGTPNAVATKIKSDVQLALDGKYTSQQVAAGWSHCLETTMKRTTDSVLFKVFGDAEKSIQVLALTADEIEYTPNGGKEVCLTVATNFLFDRVDSPIQYATVEILSHRWTPAGALFVRGVMIHPNSALWSASAIPVNRGRTVSYKHITDVSQIEIYNLSRSIEQDAPCENGEQCALLGCSCRRRKYDAKDVLKESKFTPYAKDPDVDSFDERCASTGWDNERLSNSFVGYTLNPHNQRNFEKWQNLPKYLVHVTQELKLLGDARTGADKVPNPLLQYSSRPPVIAPSSSSSAAAAAASSGHSDEKDSSVNRGRKAKLHGKNGKQASSSGAAAAAADASGSSSSSSSAAAAAAGGRRPYGLGAAAGAILRERAQKSR